MSQRAIQQHAVGPLLESMRRTLRISQETLAHNLKLSVRTIVRWEKEGDEPPLLERERIELLYEVVEIAREIMNPEEIPTWFATPKEALAGTRPIDLFSSFRGIQQIREMLERTRWGIF